MFTLKIVRENFEAAAWTLQAKGAKFLYNEMIPQSVKDYALGNNRTLLNVVLYVPPSEELYTRVKSLANRGNEVANALVDKWEESWDAKLRLQSPQAQELTELFLAQEAYANVTEIDGCRVYCSVSTESVLRLIAALDLIDND